MKIVKKRVIIAVTNDLTTDQRVDRVCNTLTKMQFDVLLIGRKRKTSVPLQPRKYRMHRMKLLFDKGPLFYAEYNFRLFLFILFHKVHLLVSNDLDTLLGTSLAASVKNVPHAHDCHEYFRGVPELNARPKTTMIWKWVEDRYFPRIRTIYAVNESIARIYENEYQVVVTPIRNVPFTKPPDHAISRETLGIRPGQRVILYQGAVNVDRGLEEAILAMKYMTTNAILVIIGTGDVMETLKDLAIKEQVMDRVLFTGSIPFQELHRYTLLADLGLSIEKDVSINYHFCLPNKFLDYIQAGVPVLVSPLPEMKAIVDQYEIGEFAENHDPSYLAEKIDHMFGDPDFPEKYRENLQKAAEDLCWEKEEIKLIRIYEKYV